MTHEALRRTALAGPALPVPAPSDAAAVRRRLVLSAVAAFALAGRRAAAQAQPRRFDFEEVAAGARPPASPSP